MKRLRKLQANEVSLVRRGANKRPLLVLKNEQGTPMANPSPSNMFALTPEQEARADALIARLSGRVTKDDGAQALSDRAQQAMKAVYRILLPFKDEITDSDLDELQESIGIEGGDVDDEGQDDDDDEDLTVDEDPNEVGNQEVVVRQSANDGGPTHTKGESGMSDKHEDIDKAAGLPWGDVKKPDGVSDDDHKGGMAMAAAAYRAKMKASKAAKGADKKEDDDERGGSVSKSADFEAITKRYDEVNRALIAKSAELESRIRKMDEEAALRTIEDDIRGSFKHLSVNVQKTARVLRTLSETDKEAHADYLENLKAVNEQMRVSKSFGSAGLYGSMGSSPGDPGAGPDGKYTVSAHSSAGDRLEAMVCQYVAKSDGKMTKAKAWTEVLKTKAGQDDYAEMCVDKQGGR